MYLDYYGLEKEAFHISPDPEFLFLSPSHKEALAVILYGIEKHTGFMLITGGVGLGKTTILRSALERIDKEHIKVILLFNPIISYENLVKTIYRELEIELPAPRDSFEMEEGLHLRLIEEFKNGRTVVLIVDEAQNLPPETLERLRMLSNLETNKEKLIQIILIGQEPELDNLLDGVQLRQIKQRIAVRAKIVPLTDRSSKEYILHRLRRAGSWKGSPFSDGALRAVIKHAKGIPRIINIVCDNALINGYGYRKKRITRRIVKEVIRDLQGIPKTPFWRWIAIPIAALACLAALVAYVPHLRSYLPAAVNLFRESTQGTPAPIAQPEPASPLPTTPMPEPAKQKATKPREPLAPKVMRQPHADAPAPATPPGIASVQPPGNSIGPLERRPLPLASELPASKPPPGGQLEQEPMSEEAVDRIPPLLVMPAQNPIQAKPAQEKLSPVSLREVNPAAAPSPKAGEPAATTAAIQESWPAPKPAPQRTPGASPTAPSEVTPLKPERPANQDQADLIDWVIDHRAKTKRGSN
jgi:general secretion pathway protein A